MSPNDGPVVVRPTRPYWRDVAERVVATFLLTFLGLYIPSLNPDGMGGLERLTDMSVASKCALAGTVAVLSLVKGLLASQVGQPDSASLARNV